MIHLTHGFSPSSHALRIPPRRSIKHIEEVELPFRGFKLASNSMGSDLVYDSIPPLRHFRLQAIKAEPSEVVGVTELRMDPSDFDGRQ